jgi:cytidine deaminase
VDDRLRGWDHAAMAATDSELRDAQDDLLRAAFAALEMAWAPPGLRAGGAALLAPGGAVYPACGVAHPDPDVALCAEAAALARAVAAGERRFLGLAVAGETARLPCARCARLLAQFEGAPWIVAAGLDGTRREGG